MESTQVVRLFDYLDESADILLNQIEGTYLDALAAAGDNLFEQQILQEVRGETEAMLEKKLNEVKDEKWEREDMRKAFQLAIIKGMKGTVQANHMLTPDAVSLFIGYLVQKLIDPKKERFKLLDLAVGSGNLLFSICNHVNNEPEAIGFEADETLLKVAFASANLQQREVALYHQDSVQVTLPHADIVASDLPVGYYPKDDVAKGFELKAGEGHSYIHHLMIEQAIRSLHPGGYAVLLVPNFLFSSDQAEALNVYLKKEAIVLGLLQLPSSLFSNSQHGKSILLLQKKADNVKTPQQALLAELPSFSNAEAMHDMMRQINKWFSEQLGR